MANIKITWATLRTTDATASATFTYDAQGIDDMVLLNRIYTVTNLQDELAEFGYGQTHLDLWKTIQSVLPASRSHTSLSQNDAVTIDGRMYLLSEMGFVHIMDIKSKVGA